MTGGLNVQQSDRRDADYKPVPRIKTVAVDLFSQSARQDNRANPVVSVVLIFLNEERFLEEAVCSVRNQTLADWELILVDDGSTDESTQIAREL
ncbi:MAG: glycosyltransferase, partial [Actinomycetia bacterium]|nr:glycosyltransferase [Actinomycetes bacterium]